MGGKPYGASEELDKPMLKRYNYSEVNNEEINSKENSAESSGNGEVREVWGDRKTAETSRGLQESSRSCCSMPGMPQRPSCCESNVGSKEEPKGVRDLRSNILARAQQSEHLQSGMLFSKSETISRKAMEQSVRVDRLRLCGNGVVPQTAEKAFRTLLERINK